jgi:hypothetical protein
MKPGPDGLCPEYTMQRWFAYHIACVLEQETKDHLMQHYARLYTQFRTKHPNTTLLI